MPIASSWRAPAVLRGARLRAWLSQVSALEWLYLAIGLGLVARYRWLFDDSFVYYRYVDNLLFLDAGLTYNAGEFVEGYTSPLHTLALVALRACHLDYRTISLGMGLGLFFAFWCLLVELGRVLSPASSSGRPLNFPLAFLATNYSVTSFFTSGNEGALLHVAAAATALLLARPGSRWLAIGVAASPLVRPELAVLLAIAIAWLWWRNRRFPLPIVLASGIFNGGWLLFRIYYYADLLPNTFYLKHGVNYAAGWRYLLDTTQPYHLGLVLAGFGLLAGLLSTRRKGTELREGLRASLAPRAAMLGIAVALTAYVVRSGGAAMHYYYLAVPFTLAVCGSAGLLEAAAAQIAASVGAARANQIAVLATLVIAGLAFSAYPPVLAVHPIRGGVLMWRQPSAEVITDPAFFRDQKVKLKSWPAIADLRAQAATLRAQGYTSWTRAGFCDYVYRSIGKRSVHPFGLTDGVLARIDIPSAKPGHRPGLRKLSDDIIAVQRRASAIDRGMFREAVERSDAPEWIARNLETLELIERKMYNRHDFAENLQLALRFSPKMRP